MRRPQQPRVHDEEVDALLDELCNVREELLSIERSLERIRATKPKKTGKASRA
jgi:hypothetical protein